LNDEFQITNNPTETFTLGRSPDPDDAFVFYAITKNTIDLGGYRFEQQLEYKKQPPRGLARRLNLYRGNADFSNSAP